MPGPKMFVVSNLHQPGLHNRCHWLTGFEKAFDVLFEFRAKHWLNLAKANPYL